MKKAKRRGKREGTSFLSYIFILIVLFVITAGVSYIYLKPKFAFKSSFIEDIEAKRLKPKDTTKKEGPRRLYKSDEYTTSIWYDTEFRKDVVIVTVEDVIRKYIKPYGVNLLDLYMDKEGVVYVDLSNEIRKDFKGDAMEEYNIIAGLYKSIQTSIPDFSLLKMKILIEGKEVESIGGHIDISRPIGGEIAGTAEQENM